MSNEDLSRREALGGGTAAVLAGLGVAAAAATFGGEAHAQTSASDAAKLNTLLRAEYDAILTYGIAETYLMSPDGSDAQRAQAPIVREVASYFKEHHTAHAARLSTLVTTLGGTPVGRGEVLQATIPTGFRATVSNLIKLAANKEKKAAIEYVRALQTISTATAADLVAAVGGVEAQHFIALYLVGKGVFEIQAMMPMVQALSPRPFVSLADASATGSTLAGLDNIPFRT
jgi:hypothetical protein